MSSAAAAYTAIIILAALLAAAATQMALRGHLHPLLPSRSAPMRGNPQPGQDPELPGADAVAVPAVIAMVVALAVAAGITLALWQVGQARVAVATIFLTCAALALCAAGYAAGRYAMPGCLPRPGMPPAAVRPVSIRHAGSPPVRERHASNWREDTLDDWAAHVRAWERELFDQLGHPPGNVGDWPPPPSRDPRDPGDGTPPGTDSQ